MSGEYIPKISLIKESLNFLHTYIVQIILNDFI